MAFIPANIGGGESSTPITPSNSNPAALTANTSVKPTTNGYAIASYDSVTPSSTPESVASGDIVKIGGSGVIVDSVPTPTSITPSNSSPVSLAANNPVNPTASGYAIEDYSSITPSNASPVSLTANTIVKPLTIGQAILGYTDLTPSNATPVQLPLLPPPNQPPIYRLRASGFAIQNYSTATPSDTSPVSLSSGSIYKMGGSGYAIASYSSKTPSDTSPASVSSGAIIKASSAGYLYKTVQPKVVMGSYTMTTSAQTITCGFEPKYIMFTEYKNSNVFAVQIYDERRSTTNAIRGIKNSSSSSGVADLAVGSGNVRLTSITSTGFTIGAGDSTHTGTVYYVAVG